MTPCTWTSATISPQFTPRIWVTAILLGVGVTVLGAVIPARQAARITPLEACGRRSPRWPSADTAKPVTVGWVVLAASIPMLLFRAAGIRGYRRRVLPRRPHPDRSGAHRAAVSGAVPHHSADLAGDGRPRELQPHAAAGAGRGHGLGDPHLVGGRRVDGRVSSPRSSRGSSTTSTSRSVATSSRSPKG